MYTVIEIENEKWQIKGIAIKEIIEQERQKKNGKWINEICYINKNKIAIPHEGLPYQTNE